MNRSKFMLPKPPAPKIRGSFPERGTKLPGPFRKEPMVKTMKMFKGGKRWCRTKKQASIHEARQILLSQCNCSFRGAQWGNPMESYGIDGYVCRYHDMDVASYLKLRNRIARIILKNWKRSKTNA